MADGNGANQAVNPTDQRGGTTADAGELREKGLDPGALGGIVPADLGGSDAPGSVLDDQDPELGSAVLGQTTGTDEPTTDSGIDSGAGDSADATADGGPDLPDAAEPDQKDAPYASRDAGFESAR
jgi:hypothetical protein